MSGDERGRVVAKLRALMARTVANGCTEEEELAAARMVGRMVEQLDGLPAGTASWAATERASPQYQSLLEKSILEGLFKAAVEELALNHINTVSPPKRDLRGLDVERVRTLDLVVPYLVMMLAANGTKLGRELVVRAVEDLIADGMLPQVLAIPRGE
ncbi:MAG: hypothetical protein ACM31L_02745 [Actinomycetota bacterium]